MKWSSQYNEAEKQEIVERAALVVLAHKEQTAVKEGYKGRITVSVREAWCHLEGITMYEREMLPYMEHSFQSIFRDGEKLFFL